MGNLDTRGWVDTLGRILPTVLRGRIKLYIAGMQPCSFYVQSYMYVVAPLHVPCAALRFWYECANRNSCSNVKH